MVTHPDAKERGEVFHAHTRPHIHGLFIYVYLELKKNVKHFASSLSDMLSKKVSPTSTTLG